MKKYDRKNAAVYESAATHVYYYNNSGCYSIVLSSITLGVHVTVSQQLQHKFAEYFKPEERLHTQSWFGVAPFTAEDQEHRILSLLLMSEMARTGDL